MSVTAVPHKAEYTTRSGNSRQPATAPGTTGAISNDLAISTALSLHCTSLGLDVPGGNPSRFVALCSPGMHVRQRLAKRVRGGSAEAHLQQ